MSVPSIHRRCERCLLLPRFDELLFTFNPELIFIWLAHMIYTAARGGNPCRQLFDLHAPLPVCLTQPTEAEAKK